MHCQPRTSRSYLDMDLARCGALVVKLGGQRGMIDMEMGGEQRA